MWWLWKTCKVMPRFRPPTSIEKHRQEEAKQEEEHGRCKTNEQSKGSALFSAGVSEG
jgi:hypothetical protein